MPNNETTDHLSSFARHAIARFNKDWTEYNTEEDIWNVFEGGISYPTLEALKGDTWEEIALTLEKDLRRICLPTLKGIVISGFCLETRMNAFGLI